MNAAKSLDLPEITDQALVQASVAGDEKAFRVLYQRYVRKVRSTLVRLSGSSFLDDMTQEVFVNIWRHLPKLACVETLSAWVYRITVNVAMDHLRQRKRKPTEALYDDPVSGVNDAHVFECRQLVIAGLELLDYKHRSVLVLHDLEQLTEQEVADALGVPKGTVKSRLFKARSTMRAFLLKNGVTS